MSEQEGQPATPEFDQIIVSSEEQAWSLFTDAMEGKVLPGNIRLVFDKWPMYQITFKGRDWHGTVPTRVMPAIMELQRDLYRAYAQIKYQEPNLRKLTEEEREQLEIVVKVEEGSSEFQAELAKQFSDIAKVALEKMSSHETMLTVLGLALIAGGVLVARSWIAERSKQRLKEIEGSTAIELSKAEAHRIGVITSAMNDRPVLRDAKSLADETVNRMLKVAKPTDEISLGGLKLPGSTARDLSRPERAASKEVVLDEIFRIRTVDVGNVADYRIRVVMSDETEFFAHVPEELNSEQKQIIQEAEWSRKYVRLRIDAKVLRDSIHDARVISAIRPEAAEILEFKKG